MKSSRVVTLLAVLLAVADITTARPSSETARYARSALQLQHRANIHDDVGLEYYGGARGNVLRYHPVFGLTPTLKEEAEDVGQEPEPPISGGGGGGGSGGSSDTVVISKPPPGASVAEARPVALAIAGIGGVAAAKPVGTAIVGPGGLAVSRPVATAIAGVMLPEGALQGIGGGGGVGGKYSFRGGEEAVAVMGPPVPGGIQYVQLLGSTPGALLPAPVHRLQYDSVAVGPGVQGAKYKIVDIQPKSSYSYSRDGGPTYSHVVYHPLTYNH